MRTLVYGAGPLGSYCAAKLYQGGVDVHLLAEGQRYQELAEQGVQLEYVETGVKDVVRVPLVEHLGANDPYDLIIVTAPRYIMYQHEREAVLQELKQHRTATSVMFTDFNVSGFSAAVRALGRERVLAAYLVSTAVDKEPWGSKQRDQRIMIMPNSHMKSVVGELDGAVRQRTNDVVAVLSRMAGQPIETCPDIDGYLVSHIIPTLSFLGLFAADLDVERYRRSPEALRLGIRARTEAIRAQKRAGIPISPGIFRILPLFPDFTAVPLLKAMTRTGFVEVGVVGCCIAAGERFAYLLEEYQKRIGADPKQMPVYGQLIQQIRTTAVQQLGSSS